MDDCMITRWGEEEFYLVTNAGTKEGDLAWIRSRLGTWEGKEVVWRVLETHGLVALQGPLSSGALAPLLPPSLSTPLSKLVFGSSLKTTLSSLPGSPEVHIARGGYTGEDGFEISVAESKVGGETEGVVRALLESESVKLAGLACRDSLRLEAGLCLYGHDLNTSIGVGEAGLGWVVGLSSLSPSSLPTLHQLTR